MPGNHLGICLQTVKHGIFLCIQITLFFYLDQEQRLLYYLHAVGAKRCPADMIGCTEGCKFNGSFDGIPPPEVLGPTNREALNQMLSVAAMEVSIYLIRNITTRIFDWS